MPRPRNPGNSEPRSRSRSGCWSCKARKIKCSMERPNCAKCVKGSYQCDYGIRLNWEGRRSKRPQLKAVPIGAVSTTVSGDGADTGGGRGDDDDSDDNDITGHADLGPDEAILQMTVAPAASICRGPLPPQAQLQRQFQLKATATTTPVTSSRRTSRDGFGATKRTTVPPPSPPSPQRPRQNQATPATTLTARDSLFSVLTSTSITTSDTDSRHDVQWSQRATNHAAPWPERPGSLFSQTNKNSTTSGKSRTSAPDSILLADVSASSSASTSASASVDTRGKAVKRPRINSDASELDFAWTWPLSPSAGSSSLSGTSPQQTMRLAATTSETSPHLSTSDGIASPRAASATSRQSRRLSVSSLLSSSMDQPLVAGTPLSPTTPCVSAQPLHANPPASPLHHHYHTSDFYGIDAGFQDLDLGHHDDANALSGMGPGVLPVYGKGGYYNEPVQVRIPRALGPLTPKLIENPMNLLYLHHFINHTASVLVPHDDPQSNPFRTILPHMALNNDHLLSLLLAYSASHRASILHQSEPRTRIAVWVQDIFPALRQALDDHKKKISNANVATAIMLASLAIVSPTAFGYNIPWQRHLMLARELIAARPEGLRVEHHSSTEGQVCSFLWSWFAYLDVLGGLSGGLADASPAWILDYKVYDPQDDDEIDCIMGFTTRCIYILSQIAELVRQCEPARLRCAGRAGAWAPGEVVARRAASLEVDVRDSMRRPTRPCAHLQRSGDVVRWDRAEIAATNEAYHWAALVHLFRRVLGRSLAHPAVQMAVAALVRCVGRVHEGGTAENCLLFPLFTAACECLEPVQRLTMLRRMQRIEGTGMVQATTARALIETAWATGTPWEVLLTTEFIG